MHLHPFAFGTLGLVQVTGEQEDNSDSMLFGHSGSIEAVTSRASRQ
jgi:hypothetical protein